MRSKSKKEPRTRKKDILDLEQDIVVVPDGNTDEVLLQ